MRLFLRLAFLMLFAVAASWNVSTTMASPEAGSAGARPSDLPSISLAGTQADPFVTMAPLIIGIVCSDGVALLALHSSFADEPLLLDVQDVNATTVKSKAIETDSNKTTPLLDIPRSYRGPFRIHSIDSFGTGLLTAGWRAHGNYVTDLCRRLAQDESDSVGTSVPPSGREYGQYMASTTSSVLADMAISGGSGQPLSCAGLLATGIRPNNSDNAKGGCLWLVDATGAYSVRAHAIGGGPLAGKAMKELERLACEDFTATEALKEICEWLEQQEDIVPKTRVELAIVPAYTPNFTPRLRRIPFSRLFSQTLDSA